MSKRPLHRALDRLRDAADEPEFRSEYRAIAAEVTRERNRLGLSQRELAELTGTTHRRSHGSRRASGRRARTRLRVANALDCELIVRLRPRTRSKGTR